MKYFIALLALSPMFAEDLTEIRGASNQYRYVDWSHSFKNKLATDLYYIGVPGNNEFDACVGYSLPAAGKLAITPFLCGTAAKENREMGVKAAANVSFEKGRLKADAYYARFQQLRGSVSSYDVLDAGNLVYAISKRWEAGVSTGFFRQDNAWNPQYGPVIRRNDKHGFWAVSYRTGTGNELRLNRVFLFKH